MRIDLTREPIKDNVAQEFMEAIEAGTVTIVYNIGAGPAEFNVASLEEIDAPGVENMKELAERAGIKDVANYIELAQREVEENEELDDLTVLGIDYDAIGYKLCLENDIDTINELHKLFIEELIKAAE